MSINIRNIGIFAHVDAGKTTLTEQILLQTGAIRQAGRVDEGTAHTDTLLVERQRGISVRSGTACALHKDTEIHIIDTPGHVDFSGEVETALLAVDGAVLVVSAVEGVQAQTAVIARVLRALGLPTIVFVNKTDRAGADVPRVMRELAGILPRPVFMEDTDTLLDALSACDDELLCQALEGEPETSALMAAASRSCRALAATPVFCGAALKGLGVARLLDAVVDCLPPPSVQEVLSVAAYHVRREGEERQVRVRVFGGDLAVGPAEGFGRVRRIRVQSPQGEKTVERLLPGQIGVAVGLEGLRAGMWLGERLKGRPEMAAPVLRAQVLPEKEEELPLLLRALERMHDETANLHPAFEPRSRRVHIRTMGEVHQQVLEQTLLEDHGVKARLMPPEVLYRETVRGVGQGSFDKMMDPWKASGSFRVEPGPRGSGVRFVSEVHVDELHIKYQAQIEKTVHEALQEGLTGWPVTDIVVALTQGRGSWRAWDGASSHFGPVAPLGLFAALKDAGVRLLEPVYRFCAQVDEGASSALYYELSLIRAQCDPILYQDGTAILTGLVPVETSQRFATRVSELSRGRGVWRTELEGYFHAPEGVGKSIPRTTPDPANPSLYMDYIVGRTRKKENDL